MLRSVLIAAAMAALLAPAAASADLRSPVLGETSTLSPLAPRSFTHPAAIASDGNTTFVAYREELGGAVVHRISATGTEIGAPQRLQGGGSESFEGPLLAVSGQDVYVAWIEGSDAIPEKHAVVASSHDGGRTFSPAVMAGGRTGSGAFSLRLAADGDNVWVAFTDMRDRIWTAGSRDGGRTFPCFAEVSPPGDLVEHGHYSIAVDGRNVHWTWLAVDYDLWARRSTDAGRTLEPATEVFDAPAWPRYPGRPLIKADDGTVAIGFSQELRKGDESGWEPELLTSSDAGVSWTHRHLGDEASRSSGPGAFAFDIDEGWIYVTWRAKHSIWLARSSGGGSGFGSPRMLAPYLYDFNTSNPSIDARGDMVVAAWSTGPQAGSDDTDIVAAVSSDHGQTFSLRTVADGPERAAYPVVSAWGPDPAGAGFAWWSRDPDWLLTNDTDVSFAPMSAVSPDVGVIDVRPFQAANDATRLAAGRPTTVRAMLRSWAPTRAAVRVQVELAYDSGGGRVERTVEEDVVLRPGLNPVQLLADHPVTAGPGRITAKVTLNPRAADSDPSNNVGEGSRPVVQPRPLRILFVRAAADDELQPACRDVRDVADGTLDYLRAAWPVDPAHLDAVVDCATTLVHPAGLTEAGLMTAGGLMARIDRQKWSASGVDKVVAVVPQGWFSRQLIDGFEEAVGIAPLGSTLDAAIVERQNTGGWAVAHELAHNLGWTEDDATQNHLNDEPSPGYWVSERRDIPGTTLDFMHFTTAGASTASPTGRWLSKATWDFLAGALSADAPRGLAAGDTLSLSGSVSATGAVTAGAAWELPGETDEDDGPLTLEQLDAAGTVLQARRFGATNRLGPIGGDHATRDSHIVTRDAAFSLRVRALAAARSLRIRRGADVLLSRARSATGPSVRVDTPARVELGADLRITWDASDADGDALTSIVSISHDGGATWQALGDAIGGRSLTVKAGVELAGSDVRVRVTTTDGWNTAAAQSGAFAIGGTLTDGTVVAGERTSGIWTAGLDGGDVKPIAAQGIAPRWSPDGRRLAWHDGTNLFVSDGTTARRLTDAAPGLRYQAPIWTPDGDRLIADRLTNLVHDHNAALDAETGAETGPYAVPNGTPCAFTRDGSRLLVHWGAFAPAFSLFRADGTKALDYERPVGANECMALSPDGRSGVVRDERDLVLWDLQAGTSRNLTQGRFGGFNTHPTWSPTGEWIVWASNKDRGGGTGFSPTDIWKIRPDGTGAVKLMDGKPADRSFTDPDVQPRRGVAPDREPTRAELRPEPVVAAAAGVEGARIALDASGSRPGADGAALATYRWDLDGDGVFTDAEGVAPTASFPDEGSYAVSVLVTDAKGRSATAAGAVQVTNGAPAIGDAKVDDGAPASFSARVADGGDGDELTATVFWDGVPVSVPLIAAGDGYVVTAAAPGAVASARLVVEDGDGGRAEATATRVLVPANAPPTAGDATATVTAGASVDIDLPARDPDGDTLEYELVDRPAQGAVVLRAADARAGGATYLAGPEAGTVTFTYRVSDGRSRSRTAAVTVDVRPRGGSVVVPDPIAPDTPPAARAPRAGTKPVDQRRVDALAVEQVATLPSTRACVSRRHFRIRVKKGDYRQVTVLVNGKRVKVLRRSAAVDLRGLPKGRFTVQIAVTLRTGEVVRSTRRYRTCAPKGARA